MSLCKYTRKRNAGLVHYKYKIILGMPNQTVHPIKKSYHFIKPNHIIKTSVRSMITKTSSPAGFKLFDRICIGTKNFNSHTHG